MRKVAQIFATFNLSNQELTKYMDKNEETLHA